MKDMTELLPTGRFAAVSSAVQLKTSALDKERLQICLWLFPLLHYMQESKRSSKQENEARKAYL